MLPTQALTLRGVRVHNLKNIDVDIPLHRLTVVTGVCGSGKSSLVFDTLYAEAQRRYLQCVSVHARQVLDGFAPVEAAEIGPLPPAIAIRAERDLRPGANVASLCGIGAPLRRLFAFAGAVSCPTCALSVIAHGVTDVVAAIEALPAATRCAIAYAATAGEPADQVRFLASLRESGYFRIQVQGVGYRIGEQEVPTFSSGQPIWVLLDRFEVGKTPRDRLKESVQAGYARGQGRIGILSDTQEYVFEEHHVCTRCGRRLTAATPRLFDPNDPIGACPVCAGTGVESASTTPCPACKGRRWNADALAVQVGTRNLADWHALTLAEMHSLTTNLQLPGECQGLLGEIRALLEPLLALDLGNLRLEVPTATLADGATRRIALARAVASKLVNMLYLIEDPTTSLQGASTDLVVCVLKSLCDRGNSVVVMTNDRAVRAAADHVIELGPGAGDEGGRVTYQGPPAERYNAAATPARIEAPTRPRAPTGFVTLDGTSVTRAPDQTVTIPLGVLCAITGISDPLHRLLIDDNLYPALCESRKADDPDATHAEVVLLDGSPPPRGSRSNPALFLKVFDDIRALFAETPEARNRDVGPGHFSFNHPAGRCETCDGQGNLTIDPQLFPDLTGGCPDCQGRRYRKEILGIHVRNRSIAEVLDLTVREAFRFFGAQPAIVKKLKVLLDVKLDHLRLGQPLDSLDGSECQRLKLAGRLASNRKGGCLFLLLEPTAGLHSVDVAALLECFDRLLAAGHSLLVAAMDQDLIRSCDCVIDLGSAGFK